MTQKGFASIVKMQNNLLLIWVEPFMSFCPNWAVKAPVGVIADSALLLPTSNRLIATKLALQGV